MYRRIEKEILDKIFELGMTGMSTEKIAKNVGCSTSTVRSYLKKMNAFNGRQKPRLSKTEWKVHCETCLYAFRRPMKSHATHLACGCELEVDHPETCRRWLDTERTAKIPEWIDVKDDLPMSKDGKKSIVVKARLSNGRIVKAYYSDKYQKWYLSDGKKLPKDTHVLKWRSDDEKK